MDMYILCLHHEDSVTIIVLLFTAEVRLTLHCLCKYVLNIQNYNSDHHVTAFYCDHCA